VQDLSHTLYVPKMHVTEGFPVLPGEVMAGFSNQESTDEAARLMGIAPEEVPEAPAED
jgi:hypothetical protein